MFMILLATAQISSLPRGKILGINNEFLPLAGYLRGVVAKYKVSPLVSYLTGGLLT